MSKELALAAAAMLLGVCAHAQTRPAPDAAAPTASPYHSAFEGYEPFKEEPLAPWREVNDTVGRVGGHMGVLRGETADTPKPAPSAQPAPAAAPPPAQRDGHGQHHK